MTFVAIGALRVKLDSLIDMAFSKKCYNRHGKNYANDDN